MLIDNKTNFNKHSKSLYDFFIKNIRSGEFEMVSGFFSIAMLADALKKLPEVTSFKMVLTELTDSQLSESAQINLLAEPPSIDNILEQPSQARRAVEFLKQDKVTIRRYAEKFCHAKTYLHTAPTNEENNSFFVVGSSNFTQAGLKADSTYGNIELNYAQTGENADFYQLKKWFADFWTQTQTHIQTQEGSKEYKEYLIALISKLYAEYNPEDIYFKLLYEFFYTQLQEASSEAAQSRLQHLKETQIWSAFFEFQKQGVLSLVRMLQEHGGAILADAVGLGKTWQALAVIKFFELEGYKVLVLCPKKLEQNWAQYQYEHGSKFDKDKFGYQVRFHTDLQERTNTQKSGLEKDPFRTLEKYFQNNPKLLVVIDESHNLRNQKSNRYQYLLDTLLSAKSKNKEVKTLLLSATPINTKLTDIGNQFKLIARGNNNAFMKSMGINNLDLLFKEAQSNFHTWQNSPASKNVQFFIEKLPENIFKLTDNLIVARTRELIQKNPSSKHLDNLKEIDLSFPEKAVPDNCFFSPSHFGDLATASEIISLLEKINFTAYQPKRFEAPIKPKKEKEKPKSGQSFLARMVFLLLIKRLESSWAAFYLTVQKVLEHHQKAAQKVKSYLQNSQDTILEVFPEGFIEEIELEADTAPESIEALSLGKNAPILLSKLARIDEFAACLDTDLANLISLEKNLTAYQQALANKTQTDGKLDLLVQQINHKQTLIENKKILIFTSFKDTAAYLYKELCQIFPTQHIGFVAGDKSVSSRGQVSKNFAPILERFAPYTKLFKEKDWSAIHTFQKQQTNSENFETWKKALHDQAPNSTQAQAALQALAEPIDILVATDCLSEGQNLQDCACVINYDIHWNPVRLIQRLGRIDRLGSPHPRIYGVNFWIGEQYEDTLRLKSRVEKRMAIMALAGTETISKLSPEMEELLSDMPIISEQEQKMMAKLQTTWDDIEISNQNLSLSDFSLEPFRQELLDYLLANKRKLENMPNGSFSGFHIPNTSTPQLIALLKHRHTEEKILVYTNPKGETLTSNHAQTLKILSQYKKAARQLPKGIDLGDVPTLLFYSQMLKQWLQMQADDTQQSMEAAIAMGTFDFDNIQSRLSDPNTQFLEDFYLPKNFELICWETIH